MADHSQLQGILDFLIKKFRPERIIYLSATVISIAIILLLTYQLFTEKDYYKILAMTAPTGVITFSSSRVLKMWSDCVEIIKVHINK